MRHPSKILFRDSSRILNFSLLFFLLFGLGQMIMRGQPLEVDSAKFTPSPILQKPTITIGEMTSRLPTSKPLPKEETSTGENIESTQYQPSREIILKTNPETEQDTNSLQQKIESLELALEEKNKELENLRNENATTCSLNESLRANRDELAEILKALGGDKVKQLSLEEKDSSAKSVPHTKGWYYLEGQGWLWTAPSTFPMIFSAQRGHWIYYERGSHDPWIHYDYQLQTWEKW